MSALLALWRAAPEKTTVVEPFTYMKADGELVFFTLLLSWILAFFFNPEIIDDNGIKRMAGYNNPCVAWDAPPAIYFAAASFPLSIYMVIRYAVTDSQRALHNTALPAWKVKLTLFANQLYVASKCVAGLIFVVTPNDNTAGHTVLFGQLIFFRLFCVAANYVEAYGERTVTTKSWIYLGVHGFASLQTCILIVFVLIETGGTKRTSLPTWYLMFGDVRTPAPDPACALPRRPALTRARTRFTHTVPLVCDAAWAVTLHAQARRPTARRHRADPRRGGGVCRLEGGEVKRLVRGSLLLAAEVDSRGDQPRSRSAVSV